MKRLIIAIWVVGMVLVAGQGWGANWYVDVDAADDTGAGTELSPWKYIPGQASSTNAGDVSSGDTVYCQKGDTWNEQLAPISGVIYDDYGIGDKPHIDVSAVNNAAGILLANKEGVVINDFKVTGSGALAAIITTGTSGTTTPNILNRVDVLDNSEADNDNDAHDCFSFGDTSETVINDCTAANCKHTVTPGSNQCIATHVSAILEFTDFACTTSDDWIYAANASIIIGSGFTATNPNRYHLVAASTATLTLTNVDLTDSGTGDLATGAAIVNTAAGASASIDGGTISISNDTSNYLLVAGTTTIKNCTIILDSAEVYFRVDNGTLILKDNTITVTDTAGYLIYDRGGTFAISGNRFNMNNASDLLISIYSDGGGGTFNYNAVVFGYNSDAFSIHSDFTGALVVNNNVFYNNSGSGNAGETFKGSVTNGTVSASMNIFYDLLTCFQATTNITANYNNYFSCGVGNCDQGANSITSDPAFSNAPTIFTLLPTSPCIEAGTNPCTGVDTPFVGCTGAGTGTWTDHDGTTVPQGVLPDIGAQEATIKFTAVQDQTYTSVVPDCTDADWDICLLIPTGATGVTFDRVTLVNPYASGLALRADETLGADAILNSIIMGGGTDLDLYVAVGKTAAGDHSAFPNTASAPDRYTDGGNSVWGEDPLFTSESTGDYSLTAGSPMIDVGTGTTADINSVAGAGNGYPDTPTNATPADAATKIARKPTLTASAVSITGGTDIGAYEFVSATHTGSQWQVCSDALCASAVYDSGDDAVNLETIGVTNRLDPKTTYYFRVRYETDAGWSEWSTITEFETRSIGGGRMELGLVLSLN